MERTLQMVFENAAGKNTRISIADPKDDLTPSEVQGVMDTIVEKNIFNTTGGEIVRAISASIITRDVVELISQD